ncbi:PepSY domain-containing protein [Pyrinomonas sp.]|uniref:PepSY domain-containing protein n=1 Tax=Pyrinomonas sp. TaxID=2080306 RepID=UPI003317FA4F
MRRILVLSFTLIAVALGAVHGAAQRRGHSAKLISRQRAESIARKQASGQVLSRELEREHGKLVYSFDIRNGQGTITEVLVDARTGRVISVKEESAQQEAQEKAKEQSTRRRRGETTKRR